MVKPKDPSLIPSGDCCYRFVKLAPGEVVPEAGPEFGRLQRECMSRMPNTKQVLCPYHERTGYGTARCLFLGREVRFDFFRESTATDVATRFGSLEAVDWFEDDWELWDMFKVCGVGHAPDPQEGEEDEDHPTLNETDQRDRPVYRQLAWLSQGDWVEHPLLGSGEVRDLLIPADGPVMVVVDFRTGGEHHLLRDETQLRRVPNPARVADSPAASPMVEPPWRAITGLVGPGDLSNGLQWRRAQARGPRGVPRVVQAVWPPFTQLGAVLDHLLVKLVQPGCLGLALRSTLWPAALPAREALSADLWPQGIACRWLEITDGCLFGVDDAAVEQAMRDLFAQFRDQVQALRVKAAANGNWWPAPQRVQLLLADGGRRVGLRLRFADGYQREHQPWVVRWLGLEPPPPRVWAGSFRHLPDLKLGEWIEHDHYGVGLVAEVVQAHWGSRGRVDFGLHGFHDLALNVARLRRVVPLDPAEEAAWRRPQAAPWAGLSLEEARQPVDGSGALGRARRVQKSIPPHKALRGLMADVLAPKVWRDALFFESVWRHAEPVWPYDADGEEACGGWPGEDGAQGWALDLLNLPAALTRPETRVFVRMVLDRLLRRLEALQRKAVVNGRWWPGPEHLEVLLSSDGMLGMRVFFPPGFEPKGEIGFEYWHPRSRTRRWQHPPDQETAAPAPDQAAPVAFETTHTPPPWRGSSGFAEALPEPLPPLPGCVWLLQTHVAGLAYHQVAQVAAQLQAGTPLILRREPGNPHDALAIEVLTDAGVKLGYVPRNRNAVLARLMDAGECLSAQAVVVQAVQRPAAADAPAGRQVADLRFRVDWVRDGDLAGGTTCSTSG